MDAPLPSTARPPLPLWLVAALLPFFVALSFQHATKASEGTGHRSAILRWRDQIRGLLDGQDVYRLHNYPNPPIMGLILAPVAELPPLACALVWFFLKVGMTLLIFAWVFRMVEAPGRPFPGWAKGLTVLLSLRPIAGDLMHGNVNLFVLFLVVGFLYSLSVRRDFLGGLLLGLAIACKVTPALFVPYLVWKRAPRALAGCAAGLALFFWPGLVPACFLGWDHNLRLVESWARVMVKPYLIEGVVTSERNNQSLPGLVYRLLTHSPSFVVYVNDVWTPVRWHNFLTLSPDAARWLVKGCMGLFALLIVRVCRTPLHGPASDNPRRAAEFSLIVLGMLLFSERTWKHHCVTLVLPFAVLSYQLAVLRSPGVMRGYVIGSLAAVVLLMTTTSISLFGKDGGKLAQVYGAYVAVYAVLLVALSVLLSRRNSKLGSASETAPRAQRAHLAHFLLDIPKRA